jgi:hypothetical protein
MPDESRPTTTSLRRGTGDRPLAIHRLSEELQFCDVFLLISDVELEFIVHYCISSIELNSTGYPVELSLIEAHQFGMVRVGQWGYEAMVWKEYPCIQRSTHSMNVATGTQSTCETVVRLSAEPVTRWISFAKQIRCTTSIHHFAEFAAVARPHS